MNIFTEEFLQQYSNKKPPFTELGEFVYYRTYSRWLDDLGRREQWTETIKRAVEYSVDLAKRHCEKNGIPYSLDDLRREAEELYDNHFHLRQFVSGRTLWVGGTPVAELFGLSNFNCSGLVINSFNDFVETFYLLMVGSGVGFRILEEDIAKLPAYRKDIELELMPYIPVPRSERLEHTISKYSDDTLEILVGDSKNGWTDSLEVYFNAIHKPEYAGIRNIKINFNSVRPKGERLKTFGGTASGHESLKVMFDKIHRVLQCGDGKVTTIMALDIANIIAENVVVGGVRRSSGIALFSPKDTDVLSAKNDIYYVDEDGNFCANDHLMHRQMSNNSIFFDKKPTKKRLNEIMKSIRNTGEPGFINNEALKKRAPQADAVNPCGEALLRSKSNCNLTTTNAFAFVLEDGTLDRKGLLRSMELSARAGLRMTLIDLELNDWDENLKKDRLLGVSVTGWQDMVAAINFTKEQERELLRDMKKVAKEAAFKYADELGINHPKLITLVKPEGTISQLPTVSSGLHHSHSPYYIRRVRVNASDPLVKVAKELGWPMSPESGQTWDNYSTVVMEFPVKSPVSRTKYDVSAIEQLETYKMFMEEYVDHNASITVSVQDHEWDDVEKWVWDNWDSIIGITFLSLTSHVYPLAPYESITEEEYNKRKTEMKPFDPELLWKYEKEKTDLEASLESCEAGGACPIR